MRGPVQKILTDTIRERMEGTTYDPLRSAQTAKELADVIKERVKNPGYPRQARRAGHRGGEDWAGAQAGVQVPVGHRHG